jgi:hypothetical protein
MLMIVFNDKSFSKFNILHTLGLKFMKSPPCKATHPRLYNIIKNMPKFPYNFFFDFIEFFMQNDSKFNNSCIASLDIMNSP